MKIIFPVTLEIITEFSKKVLLNVIDSFWNIEILCYGTLRTSTRSTSSLFVEDYTTRPLSTMASVEDDFIDQLKNGASKLNEADKVFRTGIKALMIATFELFELKDAFKSLGEEFLNLSQAARNVKSFHAFAVKYAGLTISYTTFAKYMKIVGGLKAQYY